MSCPVPEFGSYHANEENYVQGALAIEHQLQQEAYTAAYNLKKLLCGQDLNLVTAESVTSGLIASTLTDVPGLGYTLYGGFIVYDTDAKREWLGVRTEGVYSPRTAHQMAKGALLNSRAMVSLAVTGNSMAPRGHEDLEGVVDIGVALRTDPITIQTTRFNACTGTPESGLCDQWRSKEVMGNRETRVPITFRLSRLIRLHITIAALNFAQHVILHSPQLHFGSPKHEPWDERYGMCEEPSSIIQKRLGMTKPQRGQCREGFQPGEQNPPEPNSEMY